MAESSQAGTIEVDPAVLEDPEDDDYFSAGYDTSSASLTSSVYEFVLENGRRYHSYFGKEKDLLPMDEREQDRLDVSHEMILLVLDRRLHLAPIEDPHRILDVGTGTGIWAIDMADEHPGAEIIGTDINPIQPSWIPPNCRFEIDDAERRWTWAPDTFDFIHIRNLALSLTDWAGTLAEAMKCLKPGGYIELSEVGLSINSDDNTVDQRATLFFDHLRKAIDKLGRPSDVNTDMMAARLKATGFIDITPAQFKLPSGPWPKDTNLNRAGAMSLILAETGFHAYGLAAFTRGLGMGQQEAEKICNDAFAACRNKNKHMYNIQHIVYARKPL